MNVIEDVVEVFDNGAVLPLFSSDRLEAEDPYVWRNNAMEALKAGYCVATRWIYQGQTHQSANRPKPLPDMTGLVYATEHWKTWVVLNPDGTQKFVITVPRLSERSVPEKGDLGTPQHMKGGPLHIMYGEGSDGDRDDCRFYFNMHTGELVSVDFVGRHW